MHGPTTTNKLSILESNSLNFLIVFLMTPFKAPFQPEWIHPIIFFWGSYNNIGAQSAASMPIPTFLIFVTIASPGNLFFIELSFSK